MENKNNLPVPSNFYGMQKNDMIKSLAPPTEMPEQPVMPWVNLPEKVHSEDCKLCNSSYREESEALFDQTNNIKRVHAFLTKERHEDMSYSAVRNHLKYHYQSQSSNRLVKEYATELDKWIGVQDNQEAGMIRAMAGIEREMTVLGAHAEGLPLESRRKNADTFVKLADLLLKYRTKWTEIQAQRQPVTFILNQLQIVLQEELLASDSEESKVFARNIMTKLAQSCGTMEAE
jgi:hypothetical protein